MTAHAGEIAAARSKIYKCACLHLYANCSHPDRVQRGTVGAYYGHRWHILISLLGVLRHIWFKISIEFVLHKMWWLSAVHDATRGEFQSGKSTFGIWSTVSSVVHIMH